MYLYTYTSYINVQPLKQKKHGNINTKISQHLATKAYRKELVEIQGKLVPFIHIRHKGFGYSFDIDPKVYKKLINQTIRVTAKRHEHIVGNIHYIVNKYDVTIL